MYAHQHLTKALWQRKDDIKEMSQFFPVIIGEWSLGIDPGMFLKDMNVLQKDAFARAYAGAQLISYENAAGWFFWSYKLESENNHWNYRRCVEQGWFPTALCSNE